MSFDFEGITPILKLNSGCDYHRIILPFKTMGFDFDRYNTDSENILKNTKVFIFNRTPVGSIFDVIKLRQQLGFKIVMDMDDYWHLYSQHYKYAEWIKNKYADTLTLCMKNADAITVTTSLLADKVKEYNKNVHVIPNALPFGKGQFNTLRSLSDKTRFVYAGGNSHTRDMQLITSAVSKVNKLVLNNEFILAGYDPRGKIDWDKIENNFTIHGKLRNYVRKYVLPLEEYMNSYNDSDAALAPLEYNTFNQHKSNLKILEAGCKNIPIICSKMFPYYNSLDLPYVMYASNKEEWFNHMKFCCENKNAAEDMGHALGEHVRKNYDLNKINIYRQQLYNHLRS